MAMRSAFYYPYSELRSSALLRTCLLLWDEVKFIVPEEQDPKKKYKFNYDQKPLFQRAIEAIGIPHYPKPDEKKAAHEIIYDFATRQLPEAFAYKDDGADEDSQVFPDKFLDETWQILSEAKLVGTKIKDWGYPINQMCSLSIMSILADCCAGTTHQRITDRGRAYGSLAGLLAEPSPLVQKPDENYERLIPISLKIASVPDTDIEKLIRLREKEREPGGEKLAALRHKYVDGLMEYATKLASVTKPTDIAELERQFEEAMKDDFAQLKDELKMNKKETFLSKEVLTVGVVGAVALAVLTGHSPEMGKELGTLVTWGGAPVTIGGTFLVGSKLQVKRQEILRKHPMAYIYEYN
jgi:hypothetical protein